MESYRTSVPGLQGLDDLAVADVDGHVPTADPVAAERAGAQQVVDDSIRSDVRTSA
jgi:hypothetical protein